MVSNETKKRAVLARFRLFLESRVYPYEEKLESDIEDPSRLRWHTRGNEGKEVKKRERERGAFRLSTSSTAPHGQRPPSKASLRGQSV